MYKLQGQIVTKKNNLYDFNFKYIVKKKFKGKPF